MNLLQTFRIAIRAIRRNTMRSFLTALGIIIGVGAVIAMVAIGEGAKSMVEQDFKSMGSNMLIVLPGTSRTGGVRGGFGSMPTVTWEDLKAIRNEASSVHYITPDLRSGGQVIYGNHNWVPMSIFGTTPSYLDVRDWNDMLEGGMFSDRDVVSGSKVCVVGTTIKRELFQGESPVGKELRIQNVSLRVIGVMASLPSCDPAFPSAGGAGSPTP